MVEDWNIVQKLRYQIRQLKGDRIKQLKGDSSAVRQTLMAISISNIYICMNTGTAVVVSDVLFKLKFGTSCWILIIHMAQRKLWV